MLSVTYDLTPDDFAAAYREAPVRHVVLLQSWRNSRGPILVVLALATPLFAWLGARSSPESTSARIIGAAITSLGTLVVVAGAMAFGFAFQVLRQPSRMRAAAARGDFGPLAGQRAAELHPDALVLRGPGSEARHGWNTIHRVESGRSGVLIFLAPLRFHIIPRRAFAAGGDVDAFALEARALLARASGART